MGSVSLSPPICWKSGFHSSLPNSNLKTPSCKIVTLRYSAGFSMTQDESYKRMSFIDQPRRHHRSILKPVPAVDSDVISIETNLEDNTLKLKRVQIDVESQVANELKLRVDIAGDETQKAFDITVLNLSKTAPPIPGFRRQKGGKNSKVPKELLLQILGKDRVTRFVIRELITASIAKFFEESDKGDRDMKDIRISTIQTEEELNESFLPGNEFGFNVDLEVDKELPEDN